MQYLFDSPSRRKRMAAQVDLPHNPRARRRAHGFLLLPFGLVAAPLLAAAFFVAEVLWPNWPGTPIARNAPALPITVAGKLFEVPPAAIRAAVQRHPGPQQRIDLAFLWPSLTPPQADAAVTGELPGAIDGSDSAALDVKTQAADTGRRLFVTIAPLASVLPPLARLHDIYPHYLEAQATAGADGLAVASFRAGTPYEDEDLIYFADSPDRFFALCTRTSGVIAGICIQERMLGDADITLRFPRDWLKNWKSVADGFDRLMAQLHPPEH